MILNKLKQTLIPVSIVALGLTGFMADGAKAATISHTANTTFTLTDLSSEPLDSPTKIAQFDPMAFMTATQNAILNSATITYVGRIRSSGTVTNNSASAANFTVTVGANAAIDGPGTATDVAFQFVPGVGSLFVSLTANGVAPGGTAPLPLNNNSTSTTLPTNPIVLTGGDLSAFQGTGFVDFFGNTAVSQTITGAGGNATALLSTFVDLEVTVAYDYSLVDKPPQPPTGVPEPGSILGLLAVGGAGLVSRRRKS